LTTPSNAEVKERFRAIPLLPLWVFVVYFRVNVSSSGLQKTPNLCRELEYRSIFDTVLIVLISFSVRFIEPKPVTLTLIELRIKEETIVVGQLSIALPVRSARAQFQRHALPCSDNKTDTAVTCHRDFTGHCVCLCQS